MTTAATKKRLWLATLLTGLLGFVLLTTIEENIRTALQGRSRELLGGDIAVSSRRWFESSELEKVRRELGSLGTNRETQVLEIYSMVSVPSRTPQLVELVVIEDHYPLVGQLDRKNSSCKSCVWSDESLQIRWNLEPLKSSLKIGDTQLTFGGRIKRDTSRSLRGSSFAPRVFIPRSSLASTGLLRAGATVMVRQLFALEQPPSPEALASAVRRLDQELRDPGIQIQTPTDASEDEGRLLKSVADYLGLASLVGLLLAFLGCAWLLRREITERARSWAIYRVLSPRPWQADLPFWHLALRVSVLAAIASLAIAQGIWLLLGPKISHALLMQDFLPATLTLRTIALAFGVALFTSIFALWPSIRFLKRQNLSDLLKNPEILSQKNAIRPLELSLFIVILFLGSRWISHSWRISGLFLGTLAASSACLIAMGWIALRTLESAGSQFKNALSRWSVLSICRLKTGSLLVWITLALSSLLLTLMPILENSVRTQLQDPREAGPVPALFLFDIQEEQLDDVRAWARQSGTDLQFVTPLIRGRIIQVNGVPFEKASRSGVTTREEEREARFRNRGINLTIREQLSPSESIIDGTPFSEMAAATAPGIEAISVERRYAQRLGLQLGDLIDFEIQGVPITGKIVNLRRVQWTSFQPNFFITFIPGALSDAPKTFLASLPKTTQAERERWQASLFDRFPNISSIDVTRLMETLLEGFSQISAALRIMAILTGASGLAAVFSVLRLRARERQAELQLLKILGPHPTASCARSPSRLPFYRWAQPSAASCSAPELEHCCR